ncbi:unnamed protein product [Urochloa humidicola]
MHCAQSSIFTQVLSIPEYNNAIGFAPLMDYNSQLLASHRYDNGQWITVVVGSIPSFEPSAGHPFSKLRIGQKLTARIVAEAEPSGKKGKSFKWE